MIPTVAFKKYKLDHTQRPPMTQRIKSLTKALGPATSSSFPLLAHGTPGLVIPLTGLKSFFVYLKYHTMQKREKKK